MRCFFVTPTIGRGVKAVDMGGKIVSSDAKYSWDEEGYGWPKGSATSEDSLGYRVYPVVKDRETVVEHNRSYKAWKDKAALQRKRGEWKRGGRKLARQERVQEAWDALVSEVEKLSQ